MRDEFSSQCDRGENHEPEDTDRMARLEHLKRSINAGTYDVDGQLADLIQRMRCRFANCDDEAES